ncbi:thiamine diphosphokinase NDAI_0C01350 [Naumovozyma dairenensis CBS 421]|uniref:Thiamine pyrophosphokinase n=1 Tax=Naumovozyma dairenensis (strain ATCC 10597 / BCRC 20456 / CBS 421 / NBRC 0211 / NRRL Y-12639) TaxID=1071378 RepID=G0W7N5_NAUDC|nr:hypothetical protein NDAI_0C01350 [Naumovozyma dairenensis CBS 421]CCD23796.1 hypothetical protein NDAI_0C01350 [Naumovozyma dairenensis CBS 421]
MVAEEEEEKCIENPERINIQVPENKFKTRINVENILKPMDPTHSVLLILNQEIKLKDLFLEIWNTHHIRVCADGGANRLYEYFQDDEDEDEVERSLHLPDYIIGDLDSLKMEVRKYYEDKGVVIIQQNTQYSTDFTKTVNLVSLHYFSTKFKDIIAVQNSTAKNHGIGIECGIHDLYNELMKNGDSVMKFNKINLLALGGIGGRFDQSIHSITQLYILEQTDKYFELAYLTETDLIFLVPAGGTLLTYSENFRNECIGNCGLLPLGGMTKIIETQGLKWDVTNWNTSVSSGKVSSSNRFVGIDGCFINCKDSIVLNIEIFKDKLIDFM